MSAKMTIIEGNSNDKDNVRAYMVKGEAGVSPTFETSKTGGTATITITDAEGTHTVELDDGVSPTISSSKTGSVTTLTITDADGTETATINDGYSPTITASKSSGVTTITITDINGTQTATINDGEISTSDIIDNLTSTATNKPLSANQGKVLKGLVDNVYTKTESDNKYQPKALSGTSDPSSSLGEDGDIYLQYS